MNKIQIEYLDQFYGNVETKVFEGENALERAITYMHRLYYGDARTEPFRKRSN